LINNPHQIIEVSKGLSNEIELRKYVKKQDSIIKVKDSIIKALTQNEKNYIDEYQKLIEKNLLFADKISYLNDKLFAANDEIYNFQEKQLNAERRRRAFGVFLFLRNDTFQGLSGGIMYIKSNMLFGVGYGYNNHYERNIYSAYFGIKLF